MNCASNNALSLNLLGSFEVKYKENVVPTERWKSKKALALLKYFASQRGVKIPRDILMEVFWPESDHEAASNNLHTTVYFLRTMLKENTEDDPSPVGWIEYANGLYWLAYDVALDTDVFARLSQESHELERVDPARGLEAGLRALELYRGNFLQEDPYLEWAEELREHYRNIYLEVALRSCDLLINFKRDYESALTLCRAALRVDPFREEVHQAIISCLMALGRYPEAVQQYNRLETMLESEFAFEPGVETKSLLIKAPGVATFSSSRRSNEKCGEACAFVCERSAFEMILNLEKRRLNRHSDPLVLMTISLNKEATNRETMKQVFSILARILRRSDVITQWSADSIAVLLDGTNLTNARNVEQRIQASLAGQAFCSFCDLEVAREVHDASYVLA